MTTPRQKLGRWGEEAAAQYLREHGYTVEGKNIRTPYGEIDLLATHPGKPGEEKLAIFVEVKTRSSRAFGRPETAVDSRKQGHMLEAAQYYMQQHPNLAQAWRIDVIAIERNGRGQTVHITHFRDALRS